MSIGKTNFKDKAISKQSSQNSSLLMGNNAVVQGILESNVGFATSYPGTPSTEIQMGLYRLARKGIIYHEFAVNEKVAMEMAGAASLSSVRSVVVMKHVGMNVASDAFMALAYFGVKAGLVIIVVDDPGCQSSQNEQDSRFWGKFSHLPILEPSTGQEIKDTIKKAYEISEKYNLLVFVRLTNFTALNTTVVNKKAHPSKFKWKGEFLPDIKYALPARYVLHKELHGNLDLLSKDSTFRSLNILHFPDQKATKLIITQGSLYPMVEYLRDKYKLGIPILQISTIYPMNTEDIVGFLKNIKYVYFIEELEQYIENEISAIIGKNQLQIKIIGKNELLIPQENKISPDNLKEAFIRIGADPTDPKTFIPGPPSPPPYPQLYEREDLLIPRTLPRLCDGCPHRGAFYVIDQTTHAGTVIPSDIGCYALGQIPPVDVGDFWLCMGASIGTANGFAITNDKPVVAIIGDGTFFHSGIPPLLNAVLYDHKITVAILNNHLTAMTGGQPSASTPEYYAPEQNPANIEQIVKALGVKYVKSVRVEDVKENLKIFKEALKFDGPSVVIFTGECMIERLRLQKIPEGSYSIDQDACIRCGKCLIDLACPSIIKDQENRIIINPESCSSCGICANVCPVGAIKKPKTQIKDLMKKFVKNKKK
ncbi:MAG: thiamine pyrophosphate-dependent enzyme [Promethearchaeota archaeon]